MKTKAIIISVAVLSILSLVGVFGIQSVRANEDNNYPPIIQRLVEKFGLNENEVKAVFDEERDEWQQQRQGRFEEQLNQVVSDGKITEEQKQLILAKRTEMQANRNQYQDLSSEERREKMTEHHGEMKTWAQENGIDISFMQMLAKGPRGGFGGQHFGR